MKILSFIALICSLGLILLTNIIYSPVLDSPDADIGARALISIVLVLQLYFLFFSVYLSFKVFPIFKWAPETEKSGHVE